MAMVLFALKIKTVICSCSLSSFLYRFQIENCALKLLNIFEESEDSRQTRCDCGGSYNAMMMMISILLGWCRI